MRPLETTAPILALLVAGVLMSACSDEIVACGDNITDSDETCDGDCPTTCDDGSVCTVDTLTGSADSCDVMCTHETISRCQDGDGCCPASCDHESDDDCADTCGNGVLDSGETCDGRCPGTCADNNACTLDSMVGSASTCDAVCWHQVIASCENDDGCCPADCRPEADNDCVDTCGNGTLDLGETCEDDCPTTCDDDLACTVDTMTGSSDNCNVECSNVAVTRCQSGDGCCAPGCDAPSDLDCPGTWIDETVATGSGWLESASIAFDKAGALHTVYWDSRLGELRHARLDGDAWTTATIASQATPPYTDLVLDSVGTLHMVAAGRYLTFNDGVWTERAPFVGPDASAYSAKLLIDGSDEVHVAFLQIVTEPPNVASIRYATFGSGSWQTETVETVGGVYYRDELAAKLSPAGEPVVFFRASGTYRFARRTPSGVWQADEATSASPTRAVACIQPMENGTYALLASYTDTGGRLIDGSPGDWNGGHLVAGSGILADAPVGDLRVVYSGYTSLSDPKPLKVDTRVGEDWVSLTVTPSVVNRYLSDALVDARGSVWLALTGHGSIHVYHLEP